MTDQLNDTNSLLCNACQYRITTSDDRTSHYRTEWHRYNVKRRVAGLQPINNTLFTQQIQLLHDRKNTEANKKLKSKCNLCNKVFASDAQYNAHLGTKKHIKYEKEYAIQQSLADVNDSDDNKETDDTTTDNVDTITSPVTTADTQPIKTLYNNNHSDEHKQDISDSEESVISDIDMSEAIEAYNNICLFCNKHTFTTLDECLEHMLKQHGFYIPFTEYLTNLTNDNNNDNPGLLAYLGAKIGAGKTCIWCNKRYRTVQGVQQHMRTVDHCKIRLDDEEDENEYAPFYTFENESNDTQMIVSDNELIGGGGASYINEYDELVLRDGSVLGHRSLQRVYKQVYRPTKEIVTNQQQQLITQIRSKYNQLSIPYNQNKLAFKHHTPHADTVPKNALRREQQQRLFVELRNNNQKHFRPQMMV